MIALLTYFIKMLVCSGVLYAYYAFALKNNPFHRWNRGYILLATLASIFVPLIQFSFTGPAPVYTMPLVTVTGYMTNTVQKAGGFSLMTWITPGIYTLISLMLLYNMLRNWFLVRRLIREGERTSFNSYQLIRHPKVRSTFSFFDNIFWGEEVAPDSTEGRQVLRHELEHVQGGHTTDKLILQAVCILFWCNPFFHFFKRELAMIHEFLADQAAASGDAADDYARTLLQITLQTKVMLLANSFTHAPVKRRILMLFAGKANYSFTKKFIIFPILAILVFVIGCQQDLDFQEPVKSNIAVQTASKALSQGNNPSDEVLTFVTNPPKFPGGTQELSRFLGSRIRYPKSARESGITGTVFVQFVVRDDGNITDVKTVGKTVGGGIDEEAIRVVKDMPKWTPGTNDGKPVSVHFNLPIRFSVSE